MCIGCAFAVGYRTKAGSSDERFPCFRHSKAKGFFAPPVAVLRRYAVLRQSHLKHNNDRHQNSSFLLLPCKNGVSPAAGYLLYTPKAAKCQRAAAILQNCTSSVKFDLAAQAWPPFWLLQSQNHQILQQIPTEFTRETKFRVWRVVKFSFCNTSFLCWEGENPCGKPQGNLFFFAALLRFAKLSAQQCDQLHSSSLPSHQNDRDTFCVPINFFCIQIPLTKLL